MDACGSKWDILSIIGIKGISVFLLAFATVGTVEGSILAADGKTAVCVVLLES